ncbi:hypothetical protein E4U13_001685 [Claviceps humidiphila]|uniref:Integrase core domain-containing protein n=1 Tax=Claviceps humidiphila TaxID=1294629 RepID=A0A9P7Q2C4_9HYPO|nr:hypothetical protein E4U13_001685 [Claviceps humidiphila]
MEHSAADINSVGELVLTLHFNGSEDDEILQQVNSKLRAQNQPPIGLRTLQRHLKEWGLDDDEEDVLLFVAVLALPWISKLLDEQFVLRGLPPRPFDQPHELDIGHLYTSSRAGIDVTDELVSRVQFYFYKYRYTDELILSHIQQYDDLPCTYHKIRQIRLQYGMKRRCLTEEDRQLVLQCKIQYEEKYWRDAYPVLHAGRGEFYHQTQQLSERRLCDLNRPGLPEEAHRRLQANFAHSTDFRVPGPNFLWCVRRYNELEDFGFHMYACIDAYSRCIIWFHCGQSVLAAEYALKQYLRTAKCLGMRPLFTRSDDDPYPPRYWAAAQATLANANSNTVTYEDADGKRHNFTQGSLISSCNIFAPYAPELGIRGQWRDVHPGSADIWIKFFEFLERYKVLGRDDLYETLEDGRLMDLIALYAIYGPMIQDHFAHFVASWNHQTIRTRRNGELVISGTPVDLYQSPSAHDWGIPLSQDPNADDRIALNEMLDTLKSVDTEQFLEQETEDWCNAQLQEMGFFEAEIEDYTQPHLSFYLQLRRRIKQHQDSHAQPILQLARTYGEDSFSRRRHLRFLDKCSGFELGHTAFREGGEDVVIRGHPIPPEFQDQIRHFETEQVQSEYARFHDEVPG